MAAVAFLIAPSALLEVQDQNHPQLHRLLVGKSPSSSIASNQSGRTWHLASFNKTTDIDAAYRYGRHLVIFGWIGSNIGVTTIINADNGSEELEFLCFYPHITPAGLIVFERWYPHFSDPSIVSDVIAELDLNETIPHNVPSKLTENPADQVGAPVYPVAALPGVRHNIGNNFTITDGGSLLFIADRLSSGKLCLVRLALTAVRDKPPKENCLTSDSFGVSDLSEIRIRQLSENAFGDLVLAMDLGRPASSSQKDFEVDKNTLNINSSANLEESSEKAFPIPWSIQRNALTSFVPLDVTAKGISTHAQDTLKARLVIDRGGVVSNVTISGIPNVLEKAIRDAILQWRFKPTILDGKQVEVATEFTSRIGALTKIPD